MRLDEDGLRRRVKQEIRRRMKALRRALPSERRKARADDAARSALALLKDAKVVASYVAVRGELDPLPLEDALRQAGATIAYPRVEAERVVFHACEREALQDGAMGIPEPPAEARQVERFDAILVPALAVDPRGHRIGYGGGFYDRLLADFPAARSIAFIYDFQLIPEAPNEAHDVAVQHVVTDARALQAQP